MRSSSDFIEKGFEVIRIMPMDVARIEASRWHVGKIAHKQNRSLVVHTQIILAPGYYQNSGTWSLGPEVPPIKRPPLLAHHV